VIPETARSESDGCHQICDMLAMTSSKNVNEKVESASERQLLIGAC
jgi:hypothetical protein